ncbi:MAG: hypothetical protein HOM87_09600 [Proteobacteria bacterium]|nr:hypothetical protein [Pseudomonadota bacterium]
MLNRLLYFRILKKSLIAILAIGVFPAHAATRLMINTIDQGVSGQAQILISKDRIRLTHSSTPRQEMLFLATDRLVFLIHHARKELTRIDPDALQGSVNQLSGLAEQLIQQRNSLSAEKRAQLDEMLKSLGIENPDQISSSEFEITATEKRERAAGIACDWWEVRRDEQIMSETCLSEKTNLAFDSADIITLQTLATYVQELQMSASGLLSSFGLSLPPLGLINETMLPIVLRTPSGTYSATLFAIDQLDVQLQLRTPSGYRIISLPGG